MGAQVLTGGFNLPVSKWLSSMTSLISQIRNQRNLYTTEVMNEVLSELDFGKVDFGKGIINTYVLASQEVKDLQKTSTLLTTDEPCIGEEVITVDNYKTIKLSLQEYVSKDAFLEGQGFNSFLTNVKEILVFSRDNYLFKEGLKLYQDYAPGQASQTITVKQIPLAGKTGTELDAARKENARRVAETLRKTMNNMSIPGNKFVDIATAKDPNDATGKKTRNVEVVLGRDESVFVANDAYYTDLLSAEATLYHDDKISTMWPNKTIVLPTDAVGDKNVKTIGWLYKKGKFAKADFYNMEFSFFDGSNAYNHLILHFAYGLGVFKYMPGIKIVAEDEA